MRFKKGLLPATIPQIAGCTVAGAWQPALAVGGDFYNVVPLSNSLLALVMADVVGKGISAALLMTSVQA